jgi:hypothetical protein
VGLLHDHALVSGLSCRGGADFEMLLAGAFHRMSSQ